MSLFRSRAAFYLKISSVYGVAIRRATRLLSPVSHEPNKNVHRRIRLERSSALLIRVDHAQDRPLKAVYFFLNYEK